MNKEKPAETPLMKQYNAFKARYPDAILLFRIGDFYETFGEDAIDTSRILGIVLTKRANGSASHIELAGFPHHALDTYLPKLVRGGRRVAVCEQLEDPKLAKGVVKRGVTEIVTPGITLNDKLLDHHSNNYLAAAYVRSSTEIAAAFVDVSTGDFFCLSASPNRIEKLFHSLKPSETVVPRKDQAALRSLFGDDFYMYRLEDWTFEFSYAAEKLRRQFNVQTLKGFGVEENASAATAAGALLHYLVENQQDKLGHLSRVYLFKDEEYVGIDRFSLRNLELLSSVHPDGRSLFQTLNATVTPMGARLLRKWIAFPLRDKARIEKRLQKVTTLVEEKALAEALRELLKEVGDVERMLGKLAIRRLNPREATQLRRALVRIRILPEKFVETTGFEDFVRNFLPCDEPLKLLETYLADEAPVNVTAGGAIRAGVSTELDELRRLQTESETFLQNLREREVKRTGITSLKINFNKVFGYYIEISNANASRVPKDYIRKQTLANAERYITPELKTFEEKILTAEERIQVLETSLYIDLIEQLQPFIPALQTDATLVAGLDVLTSFAKKAVDSRYNRPEILDSDEIDIKNGRHPVIETLLPRDSPYIPNDVYLDNRTDQILIITGPNMAGKSALLRQTALIVLMAQMGSFVPADSARIGTVDQIFTRVGASDNLSAGESTFMVEMYETARIVNNATGRSLALLDEIGRGTSTFDGLAIAWALVEYLHQTSACACKTLFATHYHELAEIKFARVKNYRVGVKEMDGKIVFMRKLEAGAAESSFGVHVAEMAGLPPVLVDRARQILKELEQNKLQPDGGKRSAPIVQLKLFELFDETGLKAKKILDEIDVERMTPVEALLKIAELKRLFVKAETNN